VRSFLDTNVVVYAFDTADPRRQSAALAILQSDAELVVSTQVLLEAWWVLTRKLRLSDDTASEIVAQLGRLPVVSTDRQLASDAILLSRTGQLAIWDALIVEAARAAGCERVLSEDLQHGQDFGGVLIENPFA
jgi:predicted nucleic acid-binding protein